MNKLNVINFSNATNNNGIWLTGLLHSDLV